MTTAACIRRVLLLSLVLAKLFLPTHATKHKFHESQGVSPIGPIGVPFGFQAAGHYELSVFGFELSTKHNGGDSQALIGAVEPGFFLQRFDNEASFYQYLDELRYNTSLCSFEIFRKDKDVDDTFMDDKFEDDDQQFFSIHKQSAEHGIVLRMKPWWRKKDGSIPTVSYTFKRGEEGLYFLMYQVCGDENGEILSTFELDFVLFNYDGTNNPSYLAAGEMRLPLIFFFFSMSYLVCCIIWIMNIREIQAGNVGYFDPSTGSHQRPTVYKIHHLMSALLCFKFLATFFESLRYHAIRIYGHAEGWTVMYYVFTFIRGTFLFTVILLIGTGWSFVKPFLSSNEKKVVFCVMFFQVINNVAMVCLIHFTEGEAAYERWSAVFHLVDILCCCAVLVPIVWQVNQLEKSMSGGSETEDFDDIDDEEREAALEHSDKGQILKKLRLFRGFYLLVVAYIYATRILVYLFASLLSFKHVWVRYFIVELVTLTFYVTVGIMFRPMSENPYLSIKKEDDEPAAVEMGKRTRDK
jgi:hypothetical protein